MDTSQTLMSDGRTREEHRNMILSPDRWPNFYLPLKRTPKSGVGWDVAVLRSAISRKQFDRDIAQGLTHSFVVDVNMTIFGSLGEVERVVYATPDEILDAGWIVD